MFRLMVSSKPTALMQRMLSTRYVVAFADNYGLGNRIAIVTSALALAVASRRALIVLWPRGRMHGRPDYDPAGVVDQRAE